MHSTALTMLCSALSMLRGSLVGYLIRTTISPAPLVPTPHSLSIPTLRDCVGLIDMARPKNPELGGEASRTRSAIVYSLGYIDP
jgi:hypothetical protein